MNRRLFETRVGLGHRRGFSLVEVLVAVLVLALGLLGLGAVFPVVLRQQRVSTEATLGLSAQNAALPILRSHADFREGGDGWRALREFVVSNQTQAGAWTPVPVVDRDATLLGSYEIPFSGGQPIYLPLAQRLFPLPYSSNAEPRFVWDLAARLVDPDEPLESELMVVLFLRPIDPGIKTGFDRDGNRWTLTDVLLDDTLPGRDRRLAVSVDRDGAPTYDGRATRGAGYAVPIVANITGSGVPGAGLDRFEFDDVVSGATDEVALQLIGAAGQRFVGGDGVVYEVESLEVDPGDDPQFRVRPAFPADAVGNTDFDRVSPVMYLPQVSAVEPYVFVVDPS